MNTSNKPSEKPRDKSPRIPYAKIAKWSFLVMVVSFFLSPAVFFVALLVFAVSFGLGLEDIVKKSDHGLPWWYGGL